MASTYTPIATQTVSGSSTSQVTFSSIPSTYTDLVLVVNGSFSVDVTSYMQLGNGSLDTGSNYSMTALYGDGSSAASTRDSNAAAITTGGLGTSAGMIIFNIQNYKNTSTYKTLIWRGGFASGVAQARVGLWRSTSAINILKHYVPGGNNISAGTTYTLYGIAAA